MASDASVTDFVIAPKEVCDSCHNASGPTFMLSSLRGPSDYHRRNFIPTANDPENELAKANISYAQSEGALLDKEISRLEKTLDVLKRRRDSLIQFENQERSLFAPIRKLSEDLLHRIFLEVWNDTSYLYCHSRVGFPQVLTAVSSYWRSVTHSCPFIWTKVYAMSHEEKHGRTFGEMIQKCVSFSNELPLTVELQEGVSHDALGSTCIRALAQCAYRWETMTIMDGQLTENIITSIPTGISLNLLTNLSINLDNLSAPLSLPAAPRLIHLTVTGYSHPSFILSIGSAESLVRVTLQNMSDPLLTLLGLPWEQLIDLSAFNIDYFDEGFHFILRRLSNLESLQLEEALEEHDGAYPSITLPRLNSLQLGSTTECRVLDDMLIAPALKSIYLLCDFRTRTGVLDFVRRSGCSLRELEIHEAIDDISWAHTEFQNVGTLYWTNPAEMYFDNGIEYLKWRNAPTPANIFPRLESLNILDLDIIQEQWVPHIIDMLKTRLPRQNTAMDNDAYALGGRYLTDIYISFNGSLSAEHTSNFETFFQLDMVKKAEVKIFIVDANREITNIQ